MEQITAIRNDIKVALSSPLGIDKDKLTGLGLLLKSAEWELEREQSVLIELLQRKVEQLLTLVS